MRDILENGFDCTYENNQIIEKIYNSALSKWESYDKDLVDDHNCQFLKKMVGFFLKENTDFSVFSESKFIDLFCDEFEDFDYIVGVLDHLEFYGLIKYSRVYGENGNHFYVVWLKDISEYVEDETALIPYYETLTEKSYKCKAKYIYEAFELIQESPKAIWDIKIEQWGDNPDTECEFTTYMSLKEVLLLLISMVDGKTMMDTVDYSEAYTGECRLFEWGGIMDDDEIISILNAETRNFRSV